MRGSKQNTTPPSNSFTTRAAKHAVLNAEREQREKNIAEALKKANAAAAAIREQERKQRAAHAELKRLEAKHSAELRVADDLLKAEWYPALMSQAAYYDSTSWREFTRLDSGAQVNLLKEISNCMAQNLRVVKNDSEGRVILEPKDVLKTRELLPGPRRTLFHGTYAYNIPWILRKGFRPSGGGLLGAGFYLGETPKAKDYARESKISHYDNYRISEVLAKSTDTPRALNERMCKILNSASNPQKFFGAMFEVEAVLGETVTVLTRAEEYGSQWTTLHGKAGVTPSGTYFDRTLSKDEWCMRGTAHDIQARLRIVRVTIARSENAF